MATREHNGVLKNVSFNEILCQTEPNILCYYFRYFDVCHFLFANWTSSVFFFFILFCCCCCRCECRIIFKSLQQFVPQLNAKKETNSYIVDVWQQLRTESNKLDKMECDSLQPYSILVLKMNDMELGYSICPKNGKRKTKKAEDL